MPHSSRTIRRRPLRNRAWAPALALGLAAGLALTACGGKSADDSSDGPSASKGSAADVRFVLGGGTGAAGESGAKTKVPGVLQAMTVDKQGKVALFVADTQGFVLWTTTGTGEGKSASLRIPGLPASAVYSPSGAVGHVGAQAAAAPDGSYYLALGVRGLWHITADGKATQAIATSAGGRVGPDGPAASFVTGPVQGVAVADDGAVYFSDFQDARPALGFVHKLAGGAVTTVAGKLVRTPAEAARKGSGPADLDETAGAPAKSLLIPYAPNFGALAWHDGTVYADTGTALFKVTDAGLALPVISGRDPKALDRPDRPFSFFGAAFDGLLSTPYKGDPQRTSGIAYDPDAQALYYSSGAPVPSQSGTDLHTAMGHNFDWQGDFTPAQQQYIKAARTNQLVSYVSEDGRLAGALTDSAAIAVHDSHLYAANDTCGDTATTCDPAKTTTAVVTRPGPTL